MRHTLLVESRRVRRSTRLLRIVGGAFIIVMLIVLGYEIATGFGTAPFDDTLINPLDRVFLVLYWPLIALQIGVRLAAIGSTTGIIANETRMGTWDTLKITTDGAGLAMRSRWVAVFYQLRYFLLLIVAARVFFVIVSLIDYTSFQGRYLDLLISGTTPLGGTDINPVLALALAVLVAAMTMTATLILPFTSVSLDASLGMVLGTLTRGRWSGILGQVVVLMLRVGLTLVALWVGAAALSFTPVVFADNPIFGANLAPGGGPLTWIGALFGMAEGDLGLTMLHLPHVQRVWADIDFGIMIGATLLIYALAQAGASQLLIRLAVWRAAHADRG